MRRTRLRDHSINRLIPNMLTLFALCAGLTSIKFALDANALMNVTLSTDQSAVADAAARKWELAVIAIIVAAVFDALDGRIARLLDSTSKFGAELDSLSDFVAFGVAPSVVLYVWTMDQTGRIGWGCALLFSSVDKLAPVYRINVNTANKKGVTITRNAFIWSCKIVVGRAGLEPATNGLKVRCSTN